MVTIVTQTGKMSRTGFETHPTAEVYCLSTDTKPTKGIKNADALMEMDTQNIYMFNEDAKEWVLISEGK